MTTASRRDATPSTRTTPPHPIPPDLQIPYRFMSLLARRVPLPVGLATGAAIADVVHAMAKSKRLAARRNLAQVMGASPDDPQVAAAARTAFRNFGRYIFEMFHLPVRDDAELRERLRPVGLHHLDAAMRRDRGVILVTAHLGNMDASTIMLSLIGAPQTLAAADEVRPRLFMSYLRDARRRWNVTLVPPQKIGRRMLMALRRRRLVALFVDLGIQQTGGVRVTFFGRDTYFPAGAARLSRISGAPIVFGASIRTGAERFDVVVCEPVLPRDTGNETADMEAMMQELVGQLEAMVRRYPEQWYMFRDMWPAAALPPRRYGLLDDPGTAAS